MQNSFFKYFSKEDHAKAFLSGEALLHKSREGFIS